MKQTHAWSQSHRYQILQNDCMKNVLGCVIFVNSLLLDKSETYVQIKSNESIPKSD